MLDARGESINSTGSNVVKHNMEKFLEETNFLFMEEINCLYSLLHDIFVRELTGEGFQDLVNKKVFNRQTGQLDLAKIKELSQF